MFYSFIFTSKGTHMEIQATPKILKIKCLKGSSFFVYYRNVWLLYLIIFRSFMCAMDTPNCSM